MKRHSLAVLAALLLVPGALAAQDPGRRIEAAESRAAAAGVPVSLLQSRVAEGHAKGIPEERIAAAVERRAASLIAAKRAMDGAARRLRPADLDAGADAVEAGIDAGTLRRVIAAASEVDRSVAIAVLSYLHGERGVPVDEALARVTDALRKGPRALRDLPGQAAATRRNGPNGRGPNGQGPPGQLKKGNGGPPAAVPAPGHEPGSGKPKGVGKGKGRGKGHGNGKGNGG
jgi:hypothetical protein